MATGKIYELIAAHQLTQGANPISGTGENNPKSSTRSGPVGQNLLQLRVLGFRSLQDWDVEIGVFPERQELVVSVLGFICVS